jgi:flagellar biosynthetic protein FlhB
MTLLTEEHDNLARPYEATPQRLKDARQQGRVARSSDLTTAAVVITAVVMVGWLGEHLLVGLREMTAMLLDGRGNPLARPDALAHEVSRAVGQILLPLAGILGAVMMAAVATGVLQVGVVSSADPVKPRWSRLSPLSGVERIVSRRTAVRVGFTLAKITLAGAVIVTTLRAYWHDLLRAGAGDAEGLGAAARSAVGRAAWLLAAGLVGLAVLDWLYQRWQHRQDLKMTHAQWREELRNREVDPDIRRRMRRQRDRHRLQLNVTVPQATAVIASPDGPAIAIRYNSGMHSPLVIVAADGPDADRVRDLAAENGIQVAWEPELASQLLNCSRSGQAVPRRWCQPLLEAIFPQEGATA